MPFAAARAFVWVALLATLLAGSARAAEREQVPRGVPTLESRFTRRLLGRALGAPLEGVSAHSPLAAFRGRRGFIPNLRITCCSGIAGDFAFLRRASRA